MAARDIIIPADAPVQAADRPLPPLHPAGAARFEADAATIDLKLSLIDVRDRLRPLNPVGVADLIVSLSEGPLGQPIMVRPVDGRFVLVLGAHRLEAFRQMGRTTIPAQVRQLTDLEARRLEIDENIVRAGLTALERMTFLAERVEVWAALNPDKVVMDASQPIKRRGRPPKHYFKLKQIDGYVPLTMGFARDTAQETSLAPISVYKAAQSYAGLPAAQRNRLHGTWVARNDAALRQLAGIGEAAEQARVIDLLLDGRTKSIPEARALAAGTPLPAKSAADTVQRDFERSWKAASLTQKAGLLDWLSGQSLPKGWTISGGDQ